MIKRTSYLLFSFFIFVNAATAQKECYQPYLTMAEKLVNQQSFAAAKEKLSALEKDCDLDDYAKGKIAALRKKMVVPATEKKITKPPVSRVADWGYVIKKYSNGTYYGNINEGKRNGFGKMKFTDGTEYVGLWENDKRSGMGLQNDLSSNYAGYWLNDTRFSLGLQTYEGGSFHFGGRDAGFNGEGFLFQPKYDISHCDSCGIYIGNFIGSQKSGTGKCYNRKYQLIYEGNFANDAPTQRYPNRFPDTSNFTLEKTGNFLVSRNIKNKRDEGLYHASMAGKVALLVDLKTGNQKGFGWINVTDTSGEFMGEMIGMETAGFGVARWSDGTMQIGNFNGGNMDGIMLHLSIISTAPDFKKLKNCRYYWGAYLKNKPNGFGRCYDASARLIYEGSFIDGRPTDRYPNQKW